MLLHLCLLSLAAPPTSLVVSLEDDDALGERLGKVRDWSVIVASPVLDPVEVQRRLTGVEHPRTPDAQALQALLDEAAEREARFDTDGANVLRREVLKVYDAAVLPSTQLEVIAARALHDLAAALLAENHAADAMSHAKEALRRFPGVPLDTAKHPPAVEQLLKRAALDLRREALGELIVRVSEPGELVIDGMSVANVESALTRKLAVGPHRVWVKTAHGDTLARSISVGGTPVRLEIDAALERRLRWGPIIGLRCDDACDRWLLALGRAARVDRVVGLTLDEASPDRPVVGAFVSVPGGETTRAPLTALAAPADPNAAPSATSTLSLAPPAPIGPRFRAVDLLPLGVGQLLRERWVAGSIYAAAQVGLAAWHVSAIRAHEAAGRDRQREPELRERRNLSGVLLVSAAVASILEGIVVDALDDE